MANYTYPTITASTSSYAVVSTNFSTSGSMNTTFSQQGYGWKQGISADIRVLNDLEKKEEDKSGLML